MSNENNNGVIDFDSSSFIQNSGTNLNHNEKINENPENNGKNSISASDINVDDIFGSWNNTPSTQEEVKPISNDYNNSSVELSDAPVDSATNMDSNVHNVFQSNVNPMEANVPFEMPKLGNNVNNSKEVDFANAGNDVIQTVPFNTAVNVESGSNDLTDIALNTLANNFNINNNSLENTITEETNVNNENNVSNNAFNINAPVMDNIQSEPIVINQTDNSLENDNNGNSVTSSEKTTLEFNNQTNNDMTSDINSNQEQTINFTPTDIQSSEQVNVNNQVEFAATNNFSTNNEIAANTNNQVNFTNTFVTDNGIQNPNVNINNSENFGNNVIANDTVNNNIINNSNGNIVSNGAENSEFNPNLINDVNNNLTNTPVNLAAMPNDPINSTVATEATNSTNLQQALSTPNNVSINNMSLDSSINVGSIPNNNVEVPNINNNVNPTDANNTDSTSSGAPKKGKIGLPIIILVLIIVVSIGIIIIKKDVLADFFQTLINNGK